MVKFKAANADVFLTAVQSTYLGNRLTTNGVAVPGKGSSELLAFQGGAKYKFNDNTSVKGALTFTTYTKNVTATNFGVAGNYNAINDLDVIEIPAEINYMVSSNVGVRLYGDYVYNTSADDRAKNHVDNGCS